jgi:type IV pilus assembly protein PilN
VQIKDIATLRAEIDALKARQKAVEDLQTDRNTPVLPARRTGQADARGCLHHRHQADRHQVLVNGVAQTNERVSELLRNLLYNSPWLDSPNWSRSRSVNVPTAGSKEQRRLFEYQLKVSHQAAVAPPRRGCPAASAPRRPAKAS